MGIFASIFGRSDSPWNKIIQQGDIDQNFEMVIKKFLMPDNISVEKFQENLDIYTQYKNNKYGLMFSSSSSTLVKKIGGTPSLSFALDPLNRGMGIAEWFIVAYPDVIKWMIDSSPYIRTLYKSPYFTNDQAQPVFYRALIQRFLFEGNTLECV